MGQCNTSFSVKDVGMSRNLFSAEEERQYGGSRNGAGWKDLETETVFATSTVRA